MSAPSSPRKQAVSRGHKRTASESADAVSGPSTSSSPSYADYASYSTPSPVKRSTSWRNSRHSTRTFQIADIDQDEELDADADEDEEYLDQDAAAREDAEGEAAAVEEQAGEEEDEQVLPSVVAPTRRSARPKGANPTNCYAPLPNLSDEEKQGEDETPSKRRRVRRVKLASTSDVDDVDQGPPPAVTTTQAISAKQPMGKAPRQQAKETTRQPSVKPSEEPVMTEEAKAHAKAQKEAEDLQSRWTEEYFEIVEQLPLEMHRTFALMRELEGQMQTRVSGMVNDMTVYRDARVELQKRIDAPTPSATTSEPERGDKRGNEKAASEDEAENLSGGSQETPARDDDVVVMVEEEERVLDKEGRVQLLRSISASANESVKSAEEKMGLAATAYNWIDRHIRRLDADISKLESSILLGLRTGTEESRGAREALGLPVDDQATTDAAATQADGEEREAVEGISAEAESASLAKAAGAANRAPSSGRPSARTTPKMGGQAQLPPLSPQTSVRSRTRSRSRSTSAAPARKTTASPSTTTAPLPRGTRKRKPKPLSPQKGGRRSAPQSLISNISQTPMATVGPDTSEMPYDPTEPKYCYCDQISFDEMVACDNEDCTIEWFHYACVGLSSQPKNEWFCRFCAPKGWKGEGMGVPPNAKHKPPGFKKGVGIKP